MSVNKQYGGPVAPTSGDSIFGALSTQQDALKALHGLIDQLANALSPVRFEHDTGAGVASPAFSNSVPVANMINDNTLGIQAANGKIADLLAQIRIS